MTSYIEPNTHTHVTSKIFKDKQQIVRIGMKPKLKYLPDIRIV